MALAEGYGKKMLVNGWYGRKKLETKQNRKQKRIGGIGHERDLKLSSKDSKAAGRPVSLDLFQQGQDLLRILSRLVR